MTDVFGKTLGGSTATTDVTGAHVKVKYLEETFREDIDLKLLHKLKLLPPPTEQNDAVQNF